jgi:hypothetical protein
MKRYIIIGALLVSAITAHANLGDTRAESAKRYGKPWSTKGDRVYYGTRAWYIDERFNSAGYAVEVSYTKKNGEISTEEAKQFANVNVPESGWNPISPNGDPNIVVGRIWISTDGNFRWEAGSVRLFEDNRWFSYLTLSYIGGAPSTNQTSTSNGLPL